MGTAMIDADAVPSTPLATSPDPNPIQLATGSRNMPWGSNLLNRAMATLPRSVRKNADEQEKRDLVLLTRDSLAAFEPKDPIEGMIAAQAVALHNASLECFRRAMVPEQPAEIAAKLRKDGANMSRAMVDMVEALARHRGKGVQQVVRVERVVVQEGGQAIVGAVATGEGRG